MKRKKNISPFQSAIRHRFIVTKGKDHYILETSRVVLIYYKDRTLFVWADDGQRYIMDDSLNHLSEELDPQFFYKANRQFIIHLPFIKGYKPLDRVKLQVLLKVQFSEPVIISQEKASDFKNWLSGKIG